MCERGADEKRELRSFLFARDPSIDRRFRPRPAPESKIRLFGDIEEENSSDSRTDDTSSLASNTDFGTSANGDGALVYLRLRPVENPSASYRIGENGSTLIALPPAECSSTSNNKKMMEKHYSFSAIFESDVNQKDVYEHCIARNIEMEENFTVLTYGTSGSGKTFTLLGDKENPGIIPRTMEHIFARYAGCIYPRPSLMLEKSRAVIQTDIAAAQHLHLRRHLLNSCSDVNGLEHINMQKIIRDDHCFQSPDLSLDDSVLVWISFVEIYNEFVYDLFEVPQKTQIKAQPSRKNLKIVGNDGRVFIKGLTSVFVQNSLEALKLLELGLQKVNYASTAINDNSSRSHCIFFIDVLKFNKSGVVTEISYKFCDLAGSERLDKTGNVGSRLKEAQRINTSLLVLGRCIDAANNNSSGNRKKVNDVIPYRESKLTMLLQAPLLGHEKLTMIVNVTPTDAFYEENVNALGFASIAKNIIFRAPAVVQNRSRYSLAFDQMKTCVEDQAKDAYIEQLLDENIYLRNEIDRLNGDLANIVQQHSEELLRQEGELRNKLSDSFEETMRQSKINYERRLQQAISDQQRVYEVKLEAMRRQHEADIEDMREEFEEKENASENQEISSPKKRKTFG